MNTHNRIRRLIEGSRGAKRYARQQKALDKSADWWTNEKQVSIPQPNEPKHRWETQTELTPLGKRKHETHRNLLTNRADRSVAQLHRMRLRAGDPAPSHSGRRLSDRLADRGKATYNRTAKQEVTPKKRFFSKNIRKYLAMAAQKKQDAKHS